MSYIVGQKMKVTLQLEDGTFYELDAISASLTHSIDLIDASDFSGRTQFLPGRTQVEMSFVGLGDVTHGVKRMMVVCTACGSEWHDDKYHPGTCGNCGWGAKNTKREA